MPERMTTAPAQLASVVQAGQIRPRSSSPRDRPRAHRRSSGGSLAPRRSSPLREVLHEEFDFLPAAKREALAKKIAAGISSQPDFFSVKQCRQIEAHIDELNELARRGAFQRFTVDKSPLRCKYFFGEGYTYGSQLQRKGPGMEKLYPVGAIDAIPKWIKKYVVRPLEKAKVIPKNWANSAVVNDYLPGGCIVSHVDPIHIFDRPIVSCSFLSDCALSFGCKFAFRPIRTSRPLHIQRLPRGCVTCISGFAADGITHCVRPQDVVSRRAVVILRRVLPTAPRLLPEEMARFQQHHLGSSQHPPLPPLPPPPPPPPPPHRSRRRERSYSPSPKRPRMESKEAHSCDKELKARPLPAGKVPHCYADLEEQEEEEEEAKESESVEENAEAGASRKRNYRKRSN